MDAKDLENIKKTVYEALDVEEFRKSIEEKISKTEGQLKELSEATEALKEALSKTLDRLDAVEKHLAARRSAPADDSVSKSGEGDKPESALYKAMAEIGVKTVQTNSSQKLELSG